MPYSIRELENLFVNCNTLIGSDLMYLVNNHSTIALVVPKPITLRWLYNHWSIWQIRKCCCNCLPE